MDRVIAHADLEHRRLPSSPDAFRSNRGSPAVIAT
jgi:hypothetical protein